MIQMQLRFPPRKCIKHGEEVKISLDFYSRKIWFQGMISDASAYFCAVQQNLQTRKDEEPTELITALVNHHHHDNKTKKKKIKPIQLQPNKEKKFLVSQVLDERG